MASIPNKPNLEPSSIPNKPNPEPSSHDRLIAVAKRLFSTSGYENTTTVAIARAARTSESQLIKHFGSKEGLLEAVFEQGWQKMQKQLESLQTIPLPLKQMKALAQVVVQTFNEDPELRDLMLLEGRRLRREGKMVMITQSYRDFIKLVDSVIEKANLPSGYSPQLIRSSLMGTFEGLMRDLVLQERHAYPAGYSLEDALKFLSAFIDRLFTNPQQ